jgi:Zn finger protein HypA/HybF involved in hydrogenase expression
MASCPSCRRCGDDLASEQEQEQGLCHKCQHPKYDLRTQKQLEDLRGMR